MKIFTNRVLNIEQCRLRFLHFSIMPVLFIFIFQFVSSVAIAQTTITTQTGNFNSIQNQNISANAFANTINPNGTEIQQYANQNGASSVAAGTAAFRTFTIDGTNNAAAARTLRPGDRFIITAYTLSNPSGSLGISFKNNTTYTSTADYTNGQVCRFEITNAGGWKIVHNSGTQENVGATAGVDRTLQIDITSSNTFNATIAGTTYYNLGFINTGSPIASFCIYNLTAATNNADNSDSYWKGCTLQGMGNISIAGTANASITGDITNGCAATTNTLSSTNAIFSGTNNITLNPGTGNTYTGTTSITSGTVTLGVANAIPNTAITVSNNAILSTGAAAGFSASLGILTVTSGATIALGSGAHSLNFAASNGATWSGTLTVTGWGPTSAGQLFFAGAGLTGTQLSNINFTGYGTGARILASGEIVPANYYFSNIAAGDFTTGAHWYGGVAPVSGCTAVIRSGHNMTLNTSIALANLTISGGTFTGSDGIARTLTINAAGAFTNNGIVTPTAMGTVAFAGSGTYAGTSTISLTNFSFVTGSNITISTNVSVAQAYTFASNASHTFTFNSSTFTCNGIATAGTNTLTLLNGGTSAAAPFIIAGNLSVPTGTSLSLGSSSRSPQVNGNVSLAGTGALSLGTVAGGDIYLTGNWSRSTGAFTPNGRAVFFNGISVQTISAAGATETFNFLFIQNTSTAQLSATDVVISSANGLSLNSTASPNIDLNGRILTVSGGGNLNLNSGARSISATGAGVFAVAGALAVSNAGTLNFTSTVVVSLTASFNPGAGATTINGALILNSGGFILTNAPVYGAASALVYNNGAAYGAGSEWTAGATSGAGVPNDVRLGITVPNSGLSLPGGNFTMTGTLTFDATNSGTLTAGSGVLNIGGSWVNDRVAANFTNGGGTIGFTGSTASTIGGANTNAGGYGFNNLTINKTSPGSVTLNRAITVSNTLTANGSGTFSLNGFSLSVTSLAGSSASAIINNNHAAANVVLTVTDGGNNTFAGILQNGAAASLGLTKQGATNSLTLSGTNSYTGTTTISGAGKLFLTNNMTLGPLYMTASSNIDLGSGATGFSVNFTSSTAPSWTGILTVFNWTPSAGKIINIAGSPGLTITQLAQINFDNYGVGAKYVGIEVRPAFLYVTQATGSGDYSNAASWLLGDKPVLNDGTESVFIQNGFTLNTDVAAPTVRVLRAEIGGTLIMNAGDSVIIYPTGDFRITGTVSMTSTSIINMSAGISLIAQSATASFSPAGYLNFLGAFTITSNSPNAVLLPNVNLRASVNFGQNSTIQNGSSLYMLPGGFVNVNPPIYAVGSTLIYQTGGDYGRGLEWSATSGKGYPHHVTIATSNPFRLGNGSPAVARQMGGNLTINNGTTFTMEDGAGGMSAALTVLGNVNINGELRLGNAIGGDIKVGGNYTVAATSGINGTTFNNNRAVIFIGNGDQFVTKTGGGIVYFDFIVVNKPTGNVKMSASTNAYIISQVNNDLSLRVLQLLSGDIDMNGGIMTLQGDNINSLNIYVDGGSTRKIYTSTGAGEFRITGSTASGVAKLSVTAGSAGSKLLFDNNVLVTTNVGVNFGAAGITTINAQLRIDQNGYVITNSPDYGPSSTLIYNNGPGGYKRNMEWNTNTPGATGAGYPNNVIVQNTTPVDLNSTDFPATFPLGCSGKLTIETGSSVITGAMAFTLAAGGGLDLKGTLTLSTNSGGDFFVGAGWNRTGTFVQNDRMVTFDSTNAASITATSGQTFSRLTINKNTPGSSVTVTDPVTITNELFLQRGTVTVNNDITLTSDNTRTARIGETTNPANISINYGGGKFVVQRYLPIANTSAARRWRMLTAPFKSTNAPTINATWQEGQSSANRLSPSNTLPGYGTAITRSTVAGNGYDQGSTNNASIYSYNIGTNGWDPLAATNAGKITDQPGYMLFVRGDRSIVVSGPGVPGTPTTLRTSGQINIGDVTTALNLSGFQVLGNPYASAISFNNVLFNGVNPGTTAGKTFYLWDPKLPGLSNVGGWITCTSLGGGVYSVTSNGSGYPTNNTFTGIIESGAAIMVPAAGGNFTFKEPCKIAASSTVGIASRPSGNNQFLMGMDFFTCNLYSGTGVAARVVDGVINVGSDDFENAVNDKDAPKLVSFSGAEKISILKADTKLSVELRNKIVADDTVCYHLSRLGQGDYQLAFIGKGINNQLVAFVQDKFTGTASMINVSDTSFIPFRVTADSNTAAADRFRVVFKSSADYSNIKATVVNNDVKVDWNVSSEFNMLNYEIERSTDSITFNTIGNEVSTGNSFTPVQYHWTGAAPEPGVYFYRIKGINSKGAAIYSKIVKVVIYKASTLMYVFPNPVREGIINLYMNAQPQGIYQVRLYNTIGQTVFSGLVNHAAGSATELIETRSHLASGSYQLEITREPKLKTVIKIVVEQP